MSDMDYLWQDEYPTAQKEFRHGPWRGFPPRYEWNAAPMRMHERMCPGCGYRLSEFDFTYKTSPKQGLPPVNEICWNCWMIEARPQEVERFWESADRANAPASVKTPTNPKIKRFGEGL